MGDERSPSEPEPSSGRASLPEAAEVVNTYPVGIPVDAAHKDLARRFRDLVLSDEGQRILREAGFGVPS